MKRLNNFSLKMIAIVIMAIDHIGAVLFPQYLGFRIIGRIAFPIFAFTLVEGFLHTRDVKKYMMRLGLLALISEVPFDLAFFGTPLEFGHQNVFFTMFLGIAMLYLLLKNVSKLRQFLIVLAMLLLAEFMRTDYSSAGLLTIFLFYQWRGSQLLKLAGMAFVNIFYLGGLQAYACFSAIPIAMYNGKKGPACKWFFYWFYPVHLFLLYLLNLVI